MALTTLPRDSDNNAPAAVYVPGTGILAAQGGVASTDANGVQSVPLTMQTAAGVVLNTSGNQTGLAASADLPVGAYRELAVDFNLTSLTGGAAPTLAVVVLRKGADGTYYSIDSPAALSAVGKLSRSLGAGLAQNVAFGATIQVQVVVTGAPTGAAWTLSIIGK